MSTIAHVFLFAATDTTNSAAKIVESKETGIFDSVRNFYVAVVNKLIKIFPFHDDVLRDLVALIPDPALRESWSSSSVRELAISFGLMAERHDAHHDALVGEFQYYQLTSDDQLSLYSTLLTVVSTHSGQRWQRKTFACGMRFPHLTHLDMTTLSVIAHSNADSERVFSM